VGSGRAAFSTDGLLVEEIQEQKIAPLTSLARTTLAWSCRPRWRRQQDVTALCSAALMHGVTEEKTLVAIQLKGVISHASLPSKVNLQKPPCASFPASSSSTVYGTWRTASGIVSSSLHYHQSPNGRLAQVGPLPETTQTPASPGLFSSRKAPALHT